MKGTSIRQPRTRRALAATVVATVAASLAVALNPVTAAAVDQTLKNGCTSPQSYSGDLTSPPFETLAEPELTFHGWFEVESVSPGGSIDRPSVLYSIDGGPRVEIGHLVDLSGEPNVGGNDDVGYSNNGTGQAPTFQSYAFFLPTPDASDQTNVRIHFRFDTDDTLYNGFRGFAVDDVSIDTIVGGPLTESFEDVGPGWVFDSASGPGVPFWHVLSSPENTAIKAPEINPDLVTLDPFNMAADSGALPEAFGGSTVAWFGDDASGTFCGPDFANRFVPDTQPPETTITGAPSGPTASTDAGFTFTSSDPGSSFECRLDGGPFGPCSGPGQSHSLKGLSQAAHTFQVRATDDTGNTDPTPAAHSWTVVKPPVVEPSSVTLDDLPKPTLGEDVNVQIKSGVVLIGVRTGAASSGSARASQKGITFVPLTDARQIPVGSLLDTSKGAVTLQSASNKTGTTQNGDFSKGLFQVLQSRKAKGLTELALKGSSFKRCTTPKRGKKRGKRSGVHAVGSAGRTIRRLSGNANGRFRTRGRRSAATVRGTVWDVTDRCDGTLTKVKRGKVAVRDFRLKKTIVLRSGKSYLAR